jgi:hypothetical protein
MMANPSYLNKEVVAEAVVDSIKNTQEDAEIRTPYLKGYEKPDTIKPGEKEGSGFIPDVEFRYNDRVELYEIELNTEVQLQKWRLFSLYAKKVHGKFNIVTQKENLPRFRELLNSNKISAKLIYF